MLDQSYDMSCTLVPEKQASNLQADSNSISFCIGAVGRAAQPLHDVCAFHICGAPRSFIWSGTCALFPSEVGGEASLTRTEHPNREVVSSRPCVRARSVIHVESGIKWLSVLLPFSLCPREREHFPFPFRICQLELV